MTRKIVRYVCLLVLINSERNEAVDPIEGLIRDFAFAARSTIQQALNQFSPLQIETSRPNEGGISFQTDEEEGNRAFRCPLCHAAPPHFVTGTWNLILWSRSFRLTTLNDLNSVIDKLASNRPIYTERSVGDLLVEAPNVRCPRLTLVDDREGRTKFELMYQLFNGRQKSIVGFFEYVAADGTYFWRLAPTLNTRLCVAFTNISNRTSDYDFVVFNQIDSWPECSNYVAVARTRTPDLVNNLRDFLEQQQLEGPLNKLEKVLCPHSQQVTVQPVIVAVPEDPFAPPKNLENSSVVEK